MFKIFLFLISFFILACDPSSSKVIKASADSGSLEIDNAISQYESKIVFQDGDSKESIYNILLFLWRLMVFH